MTDRLQPISFFCATVCQLPDDGQKIGRDVSQCKIRIKAILGAGMSL